MKGRNSFGSRFGVLVAMAGSAVGLGNLWRFPYLLGEDGGGAFLFVYLLFVVVLCIPIMICEFLIGRRSQTDAFGAFKELVPGSKWGFVGLMGVFASVFIVSFYSVVGGWSVNYLVSSLQFKFTSGSCDPSEMFSTLVSSPVKPVIYHLIFLLFTALIIAAGVKKGIERYTKLMMPLLFVMIIIIAIRSMTLPGASAGLRYLFKPDFSKIDGQVLLDALGQAFFSLSLGIGTILTYASYVKKEENILKCTAYTSIADTLFAIIAGCAIMPAVFSFGLEPGQGPGLVFVTLPGIFAQLPLGGVAAILFFFTLFLAALTSCISMLEVIVALMVDEFKMKRGVACVITFIFFGISGTLCSLSQGTLADLHILGKNIFDLCDFCSANILMPLGAIFIVLFVGWKMPKPDVIDELTNGGTVKTPAWLLKAIYIIIRYIAPVFISIIFLAGMLK